MSVTTTTIKGKEDAQGAVSTRYGKLILIGDSDFANNTNINLAGNGDLFLNTINWLAEEANLIAVRAKKRTITPVVLTRAQARAIFWIPVVMIPSAVLIAGDRYLQPQALVPAGIISAGKLGTKNALF